jgi:hypothetical protein
MNRDLKEWQSDLNFNEHMDSIYYEIKLCVKELHQKFKELYENNDFYVFDRSCFKNLIYEMIYEDWRVKVLVDECHKQKMFDSNIISFFMKNNGDNLSINSFLDEITDQFGIDIRLNNSLIKNIKDIVGSRKVRVFEIKYVMYHLNESVYIDYENGQLLIDESDLSDIFLYKKFKSDIDQRIEINLFIVCEYLAFTHYFIEIKDFPSIIGNLSKAMRMFGSVFKAHDEYLQSARADARSAIGKSGGLAKAKAFDFYKEIVLNEWKTRKHRTYEECANFLISQNKVDVAHRTITKWIADFEKENRRFRTLG